MPRLSAWGVDDPWTTVSHIAGCSFVNPPKKKDESGTTRARGQQHGAEPKSFRRVAVEPVDLSLIAVNSGLHRRLGEPSDRIVCENLKWTTDMYWMSA